MKISVVVTAYNLSKYIEECILSIINQTHLPYEVILSDDSSTDDTINIAKRTFPKLIVVKQKTNVGALFNTLSGLNTATGEVVAFIDGDDTWPLNKLEAVVKEFKEDDSVFLVTHNHRRVNSIGVPIGKIDQTHKNVERILRISDKNKRQLQFRNSILMRKGLWFGSVYSLRRSVINVDTFINIVKKQPNSRFAYLDLVLAPFVTQTNPKGLIVYLEDIVFDYRLHDNNSASSNSIEKQQMAIKRGRATNLVTINVLTLTNAEPVVLRQYGKIILEYDFLEALYKRDFFKSFNIFLKLLIYFLHKRTLSKEIVRFILVMVIGPSKFLKIK